MFYMNNNQERQNLVTIRSGEEEGSKKVYLDTVRTRQHSPGKHTLTIHSTNNDKMASTATVDKVMLKKSYLAPI